MKKFICSVTIIVTLTACSDKEQSDVAQDKAPPARHSEIANTNISPWSPPAVVLPPAPSSKEENKQSASNKAAPAAEDETTDTPAGPDALAATKEAGLALAKKNGCLACHSIDQKLVGPPWKEVAKRYKDDPGAREQLILKVKQGGKGNWTDVTGGLPMPPYAPRVLDKDIDQLVDFVLSLSP